MFKGKFGRQRIFLNVKPCLLRSPEAERVRGRGGEGRPDFSIVGKIQIYFLGKTATSCFIGFKYRFLIINQHLRDLISFRQFALF